MMRKSYSEARVETPDEETDMGADIRGYEYN